MQIVGDGRPQSNTIAVGIEFVSRRRSVGTPAVHRRAAGRLYRLVCVLRFLERQLSGTMLH